MIIPIFRKVDAVYYDKGKIARSPVLGISQEIGGNLNFVDSDIGGWISDPTDSSNFLGYEFDGQEKSWTKEIKTMNNPIGLHKSKS